MIILRNGPSVTWIYSSVLGRVDRAAGDTQTGRHSFWSGDVARSVGSCPAAAADHVSAVDHAVNGPFLPGRRPADF